MKNGFSDLHYNIHSERAGNYHGERHLRDCVLAMSNVHILITSPQHLTLIYKRYSQCGRLKILRIVDISGDGRAECLG